LDSGNINVFLFNKLIMKGKVSFDFDSTLDRRDVQQFAKKLINDGFEVWIVTSRTSLEHAKENLDQWSINRVEKSNLKLFRVADNLGIKREHIHFTNHQLKVEFLEGKDFIFHLDDDSEELLAIMISGDKCEPFNVGYFEWEELITKKLYNDVR
jgi:hypothetical protein